MGVSGQRHAPAALYSQERILDTHWIGHWVGLRAGPDPEARENILYNINNNNNIIIIKY
jgi:hypothetical protein